jgi:sialate O-acetylesterase
VLLALVVAWGASAACGEISLGTPFADGMVLQRDRPAPVWGWTEPGQTVTVELAGRTQSAQADANGRWRVTLPAVSAGGPHELIVRGPDEIRSKDVLVGEVWICSGQSNMDMALNGVDNASQEIAAADYPQIRTLRLPVRGSGLPRDRLDQRPGWQACSPKTASGFSAVAYFFGRELHRRLDVPIGLIVVATGATPIELWVPRQGLALTSELAEWSEAARQADQQHHQELAKYRLALAAWEAAGKAAGQAAPAEPVHPYLLKDNDRRGLGTFFHGAVAPVAGYGIRGMIWYQGESNRGDSSQTYFIFHKALVQGWREVWGQGEFPFYYVQISALDSWRPNWQIPEIWEGQTMVLQLPNTGMAVIHDLCRDLKNIHPKSKAGVGRRLALWALAKTYGVKDLPYSGPIYKSHEIEGQRVRLRFDYTFGGLQSRDGRPLDWFTVAGADGEFVPAQAEIDGDWVIVWSQQVEQPMAVQFAWDETAQPNLVNGAGLPAGPFRTDRPW